MDPNIDSAAGKPKLTIHYLRPGFQILEPDEIEKGPRYLSREISKISPTIMVKCGAWIKFSEAKNMLFIEQNTTIPVPKVHAVYSHLADARKYPEGYSGKREYTEITYIFMDFVPGATIEKSWDEWDEATIANVQNELKDYIRQLRGIPGGEYIGSLDRGPVTDSMLRLQADNCGNIILCSFGISQLTSYLAGPFDSEEEFNIELRKTYWKCYKREVLICDRLDAMLAAHKHQIVFTHNDLHYSNIMVHDGHISGIIDWSDSGWYPDYWEYTSAMRVMNQRQDWNTILDNAIGRPHCEFLIIEKIRVILPPY
ncbi:hypothetical protein EPUS_09324 [Endocarpon pusillum Z07020]|uniref:Aminoglycoside phosphotransferase domain-containing protein n=1 Tax=Endocarpon pusillum (strain Z07020 / HMAS-L-300199) TaxID=1263415 RepID=U1GW84_ENDPU|nr:uncharacterized protein EPUS_09324 [Endocarpon pusillum Z07020]ERF76356.1 hypothetical protein EPUS_09324 [Endocarpon pusillum Z07020]